MKMSKRDLVAGILVTVLWGCNFSVIELGLRSLDPYLLTLLRFVFCAMPLVFFVKRPAGISYGVLALYGVMFGAGLWWVVNFAMYQGLSPGMSSVFLQFSAFFTILLSSLLLGERVSGIHLCGMASAACGLIMILALGGESSTVTGVLLVLIAALAWSLCNLVVKLKRPADMVAFIIEPFFGSGDIRFDSRSQWLGLIRSACRWYSVGSLVLCAVPELHHNHPGLPGMEQLDEEIPGCPGRTALATRACIGAGCFLPVFWRADEHCQSDCDWLRLAGHLDLRQRPQPAADHEGQRLDGIAH